MTPQQFVTQVCRDLPGRIRSIILYGSAAAGDFVKGASGYDLLIVIEQLSVQELDTLAPTVRDWRKAGNPLPLLFTPDQLSSSADAFAIEFLEMKQAREVLYGSDPINAMSIDPAHVRIHLERELKGKSLALRDRYVLASGDQRLIAELLVESLATFLSLFRSVLRLYQADAPRRKLDALQELTKHISFDPQAFLSVEALKERRHGLRSVDTRVLFGQYCQSIETITNAVDKLLQSAG